MGLFNRKKKEEFISPMKGKLLSMEQVPDPAFAQKIMGDGVAIELTGKEVVAPFSGTVAAAFPTGHAFGIRTGDGMEILLHIGIDTVNLEGRGFEVAVRAGDTVKQGDLVVKVDTDYIKSQGKSVVSPIIFTSGEQVKQLKTGMVDAGEEHIIKIM